MSRIAYVDGQYVPHSEASVHIEDRGYQFADGVYEVVAVCAGRRVDDDRHFARLERSLGELEISMPMSIHRFQEEGLDQNHDISKSESQFSNASKNIVGDFRI